MPIRKPKDPERSSDLPQNWIQRQLEYLEKFLLYDAIEIRTWDYRRARLVGSNEYEYLDGKWGTIDVGDQWGGYDVTGFFRKVLTIPHSHAGPDTFLDIDMDGGETQLSINGRPWQGLDWYRSLVPLGDFAQTGRELELEMEAFIINHPYDERRRDEREHHRFAKARLVKLDRKIDGFLYDARFVLDAYLSYWQSDENREIEGFLLHHLEEVCRLINPQLEMREEIYEAVSKARHYLRDKIYASDMYRSEGRISICAHSHLDIVYLWPIKETLRKNCRTITNMLSLMREYPFYRFSYSQPFLYEKLKEIYPDVFEEVKQRVRDGRWEVIGAMYLEPDGNLLGPESLVRQLLFGKRFIRQEFDIDAQTCWLPDVFGVMYTLPQILKKAGVNYFSTAKLNIWNDTNVFPYDTFRWRGPDGSEVIAHFPPTHFAQAYEADNLRRHWRDFREKHITEENLFIYGYGDGGGGPTREMVEGSQRSRKFPGLPETKIEFAEEFFRRQAEKAEKLPVWDDELYLEAHRGTYTTKASLKRFNRKVELLYRDAEILSSMAWLYGAPRAQERLNEGWKYVLLNQFHDTLPGTHKPACVSDIERDYQAAFAIGEKVRSEALTFIMEHLDLESAATCDLLLFNTLSWERSGLIDVAHNPHASSIQFDGVELHPIQHYNGRTWVNVPALPSMGWSVATFSEVVLEVENAIQFAENEIVSLFYKIELDENGNLASIWDQENDREVLSAPGNAFQVYEDNPGFKFNAWDIAYHLEEYSYPVRQTESWRLKANGPLFAVFTSRWQVLDSTIEQEMWLYANDPRIDFQTSVEWQNSQKLMKVAFPLQVRARFATYDLPFGNIERATHRNTSWEQAKFEVCGHKWVDMSEGNYGVALLNDCKYGYDAKENVLRLSLLRSPIRPDGQSDIGSHQFTYALLPHAGGWRQAQVDRHAYELNIPPIAAEILLDRHVTGSIVPARQSVLEVASPSLIVEAIKQAEDSDALVLRTFDSHGSHSKSSFACAASIADVVETDLLEENPESVELTEPSSFHTTFSPYEIKTHLLHFHKHTQS